MYERRAEGRTSARTPRPLPPLAAFVGAIPPRAPRPARSVGRRHPAQSRRHPLPAHGSPTGDVFNISGAGFDATANGNAGSSVLLFATTDGTISGWNPPVDRTHAIIGATNSGAVYTGLAIGTDSKGDTLLYAANFPRNTIDVYDQNFQQVTTLPGHFTDSKLPDDNRVFNVQAINNQLFVEYAPFDPSIGHMPCPAGSERAGGTRPPG